jgi:heme/copper-type cytochrome/quinol oxidase subunit 2
VTAQQFTWSFEYENGPAKGTVSPDLYLPVDKPVLLEITSKDVIHSFWVPQFGQKQDAVPGQVNPLVITPTRLGTYPVICTELCGLGHALMRRQSIVMSQADFAVQAVGEEHHRNHAAGADPVHHERAERGRQGSFRGERLRRLRTRSPRRQRQVRSARTWISSLRRRSVPASRSSRLSESRS